MAKIFLDANFYIDILQKRSDHDLERLQGNELFISPLSIHILIYVYKYTIPNQKLDVNKELFNIVPFDQLITENALIGPTNDFEDNMQLHSAAEVDCDVFLTQDKKLLDMKFFGKTKLASSFNFDI
ncbi:MAG: type II toxin-antitoxin system VapC family toxin [Candidatus Margulisiibacteriota bacterium]